ncbi:GPI mannosyltransferase 2 [Dendryphion nanum]|uniref:GPI mannosyltransferase 2 n=1 Tax=Dendryphion nanum TaxID=256645 RepID=A0A9P9IZ79_9PLEO|nr:GPI mannosyltransferase 2 [Dendryphion nanum]
MGTASDRVHTIQARQLIPFFFIWKSFLFIVAALSPGPGYDTSSLILLKKTGYRETSSPLWLGIDRLTLRLLRWDALYFVSAAQRDYVYEQEWAFSWAYSHIILRRFSQYIPGHSGSSLNSYVWAGIIFSNICHLISVLVLHRLLRLIVNRPQERQLPFIACILHILSPAGLFLSAPYAEGLFSALNFTGMLCYVIARTTAHSMGAWGFYQDAYLLGSGLFFALASLFRSNGLLSGLILLYDVIHALPAILTGQWSRHDARRIGVTCVAGSFIAAGFIMPQFLAYRIYCTVQGNNENVRPWCNRIIPSIYTWVQSHYWNVGFLRYWTLSNVPLFLLAAPMIWILIKSSVTVLQGHFQSPGLKPSAPPDLSFSHLALPQLALAIAATTSFHVQVINRLSSGYPMWYLVIAKWMLDHASSQGQRNSNKMPQWIVRSMVMYAIIQGLLFANFLPPA